MTHNTPGPGTWVCPPGVTSVTVETWGGGGGGGYSRGLAGNGAGGGGGGGYTTATFAVTAGTTYHYVVGAGGAGGIQGPSTPVAAQPGGLSCFTTAINCTGTVLSSANGGLAGAFANLPVGPQSALGGAGGAAGTFSGTGAAYSGGNGANGIGSTNAAVGGGGGGGGGASTTGPGGNATGKTGGAGAAVGGGNGANGLFSSAGSAGATIGGGGSGGHRTTASGNVNGGAGAGGQVRITYATPPCFPPAQATALTWGTNTTTTISGSFSGSANGYLVVRSNTATPPSQPVNGVTYSAANIGTLGAGLTFVQSGASTAFTTTGLTGNTRYYFFVYAFTNSMCLGGPTYNTTGALAGNSITCPNIPNTVTTSAIGTSNFTLNWTAPTGGSAAAVTYIIQVTTDPGYTADVAGSPFSVVAPGVNRVITGLSPTTTYYYRILASNGCSSNNVSGSITTIGSYCASTSTGSGFYIDRFSTTGGILNITNNTSGFSPTGYGNFTSMVVSQNAGVNVNFSAGFYDGIFNTYGFTIWVDWNNDAVFGAGEQVFATNAYVVSAAGSFPIPVATAPGGYRMRIRANYLSTTPAACGSITSGETEDYTLVVAPPLPCSGNPTSLSANILTANSVTLSWVAASPAPANGYHYYISTSATNPLASTTPTGSVATGTSVTITPLTAGVRYYYWIRSNCGGALGQGAWMGPQSFLIPTCGIGNSTGTTTLGCHNVVSGGLGLNGADVPPTNCTSGSCVTLEANYLQVNAPTNYTVASIPYAPPYQFNCLKNPVSVNDDDVWSPIVNLPFNFCFYGNNYSQCLISSNGAITFDLTNNTPGGTSAWSFANNLPSTNLFRNAIFGVYHDIDPRVGGEVGWELITLNTGCRALVAAWHDIPMYSSTCNSMLYTGMMVLYENTNVIDVFIEQKPVCGSWNSGNAVVGVQNAAGTAAVVPPGRNSLDPDWTVTNEAWRFTPSGATTASINWYEGAGTSGPIVGTGNTLSVCPGSTTIYTAEVTYNLCSGRQVVVSDQTTVTVNANKTWNGSVSTAWNNAANWTPSGVPTNLQCVAVPTAPNNCVISGSAYAAYCHNITVQNGGVLRIDPTNNTLTVTDVVNVNAGGTFNIMNTGGLIQVNNVNNFGTINYTRISQPMYRYDYTYWGSPVTLGSNYTLGMLSPATLADKYYSWTPFVGASYGTWNQESSATVMDPRKGYIVRAPQTYSTNPSTKVAYTATFTGTPNNGNINSPVLFGTMGGPTFNDQYNLLANPYPSSISAATFLNLPNNAARIDGTIYFWTHNSAPSTLYPDPFYNDFLYNYTGSDYASWNKVGGVGTAASTGGTVPNGYIAAGQSFFVRSLNVAGNAMFNNSMRSAAYTNSQFFRPDNDAVESIRENTEEADFEKHRLWLNMMNPGSFSQILVAYAEGATDSWERGYDGHKFEHLASNSFYSLIDDEVFVIQAKALPLDEYDQVPLGYNSLQPAEYTIRIDHYDGDFEQRNIYLEDKLLNVIHDLKQSPYSFTTAAGHFEDRLVLRYHESALGNTSFSASGLSAFIAERQLNVSATEAIESIDVFEVNGKLVKSYLPDTQSKTFVDDFVFAQGIYFAKVKLTNGTVATQKLMNR
ncbi:GEVED domain-containing protein [Flavobacterium caeni]|uniref:GEVED domain-containing protein n=1 Tax=Flavobacterium caeni TaxID=490189 RepID=UPI0011130AF7|nr:GEVED domain-containing protein [Flavobacterium caeni]